MQHFWTNDEAVTAAASHRRMTALNLHLDFEPPTKRTRAATRRRATEALIAAFDQDPVIAYARQKSRWPKPRAAIALDISVFSTARNGARIDSACKWLLDELNGRVYADDRQVKLLFARMWRPIEPLPRPADGPDNPWGSFPDPLAPVPREPTTHIAARTRASVLADLRAAGTLDERWDRFADVPGLLNRDPLAAELEREFLLDYQSVFDPADPEQEAEHRQVGHQLDYHDQTQQQHAVDLIFSSLLTDLPVDRFGVWSRVRNQLAYSPYIFDLGPIPGRGQGAAFQDHVRGVLEDRRNRYPHLFPLRATSGISMVLFEAPGLQKDLDNLVRESLPAILDILRPPKRDLPGWIADEPDPRDGDLDIPFIEVAAIPADRADVAPGTLVLGLSSGLRGSSWWELAADHLDEAVRYR